MIWSLSLANYNKINDKSKVKNKIKNVQNILWLKKVIFLTFHPLQCIIRLILEDIKFKGMRVERN